MQHKTNLERLEEALSNETLRPTSAELIDHTGGVLAAIGVLQGDICRDYACEGITLRFAVPYAMAKGEVDTFRLLTDREAEPAPRWELSIDGEPAEVTEEMVTLFTSYALDTILFRVWPDGPAVPERIKRG